MKIARKQLVGCVLGLALAFTARADTIINNFNSSSDFVANGIIGNTNWDGVYLGFGDVTGGANGGDGNGATVLADSGVTFPTYLTLQTMNGSWSGTGDDGFFLYKVVRGDFDMSVQSAPPWTAAAYNFAGLMVRLYNTNNSGAPFSTTITNAAENWMSIFRFQEFSINEVRYATNGANTELTYPEDNADTNTARFYRIQRTNDTTFNFYTKTNSGDAWFLVRTLSRPAWSGMPVQVGIAQATFTGNSPAVYFTGFQLSGTNVSFPTSLPAAPSGVAFSSPATNGEITLSWTPGAGSDGSLVVVRHTGPNIVAPLIANPVNGTTYLADTNVQDPNTLLSAGGTHVVYAGSGSSVRLSGLLGSNNTYRVAVYSYSSSSGSIVYNTASPTTNFAAGPGIVTGVSFTLSPTNIPAGGVAVASVNATYSTGDSYDVSADPTTIWNSSDPSIAIATNGTVTGISVGTVTVSATYAGVPGTGPVSVHTPSYTDNFGVSHNYLTQGLPGSTWDGLYLGQNDFAGQSAGSAATVINDANVTSNNVLTISAHNTAWEGGSDNGYFLFKNVAGDFQVAVHIANFDQPIYHFVGLQARAANPDGSPLAAGEYHLNLWRFDEFGISTSVRRNTANGLRQVFDQTDGETSDYWLLMTRQDGTTFNFYKRASATNAWIPIPGTTITRADLATAAMQVGLAQAIYTGNTGTVQFANFMLDATNVGVGTPPAGASNLVVTPNLDGTITLTWTPDPASDGSLVVMHANGPVTAQPAGGQTYIGDASFGSGSDLGGSNYVVYVGTGSSVTVSNLTPGYVYYADVYAYSGSGVTSSYSVQNPSGGTGTAIGTIDHISLTLPPGINAIPDGGIAPLQVVAVYTNGIAQDVSTIAVISSVPPGAIVGTNGILTALTNGGPVTVYAEFANTNGSLVVYGRNPSFTDNFNVSHDYVASGVMGSGWDGVYTYPTVTIPGATYVSDAASYVYSADANTTSNGVLTVTSENVGWEFGQDDGFFLYKYVPGDFQMAVHITTSLLTTNGTAVAIYNYPGLLARAYSVTNATLGAPFDLAISNAPECWISWARFDEFGIGTRAELTFDDGTTRPATADVGSEERWLLMVRQNGSDFRFYQRLNATDPWKPSPAGQAFSVAQFAGIPMQVGIMEGGFNSGVVVTGQFDHFMLDSTTSGLQLQALNTGSGSVMLSWPADPNAQVESTTSLNPPNWQPVAGTPTLGANGYTLTLPIPVSGNMFFRLKN